MPKKLNKHTRSMLIKYYTHHGLMKTIQQTKTLIRQCERENLTHEQRVEIKGELAEAILEIHLFELQKYIPDTITLKNLCLRNKKTGSTAELDVTLFTPFRIYLFECKSYMGKKVLVNECTLSRGKDLKDVYRQSKHHVDALDSNIRHLRKNIQEPKPAYKLVMFELSTDVFEDKRDEVWKRRIPAISLDNLWNFLRNEMQSSKAILWDTKRLLPYLRTLDSKSEKLFKEHLARLTRRN